MSNLDNDGFFENYEPENEIGCRYIQMARRWEKSDGSMGVSTATIDMNRPVGFNEVQEWLEAYFDWFVGWAYVGGNSHDPREKIE